MSARRIGSLWTTIGMQAVGGVTLVVTLLLIGRGPAMTAEAVPWALALAATGAVPLWLLYRALALGPIAVVSPIVASYSALTVILVVVFLGERLNVDQVIAIAITFFGVLLATTDLRRFFGSIGRPLPGARVAILSTLGFAVWGALLAAASRDNDGLTLIVMWRAIAVVMLGAVALAARRGLALPVRPTTAALVVGVGVFDTLGNAMFVLGATQREAAVTATGSGLYPVVPALLGIWLLGERLAPNQYVGIAVTVIGLVALGLRT